MIEWRGEVVGVDFSGNGKDRDVAVIPMALVRVGEGLDRLVLVFITRAAAELGDRAELDHAVRHRGSGKGEAGPNTPGRLEADVLHVGDRRRAEKRIHAVHGRGFRFQKGGQGEAEEDRESFHQ